MNLWQRWRQQRRWKRAARKHTEPLREFVYMDDVSVYSLVASQVGLIVTELTETQATSLQSEVSAGFGTTMPFAKAEVGSKVQAGENHSSQVLRKAIIQTTFKQLHEAASGSGALVRLVEPTTVPRIKSIEDIRQLAKAEHGSAWVFRSEDLTRGDLIEMDVQLEAEPIYQASVVISGMLDIVQDDPAAFGVQDLGEMAQLRLVSRMLDKVLAGLVPLRGRCLQYLAVEVDGRDWLVHKELASQLTSEVVVRPVFIVGVAQQALFWKDVRRVLFSGSNYRVMARLTDGAIQPSWTPVKLVDVIGGVIPDFAATMDTMNRTVLSAMFAAVAAHSTDPRVMQVNAAKRTYASLLAARCGIDVSEHDLGEAGLLDAVPVGADVSVLDWRELLAPIAAYVQVRSEIPIDRETAADYRVAAIASAGLLEPAIAAASPEPLAEPPGERFLDSEIVAVYW